MKVAILTADGWAEIRSIKDPDGTLSGVVLLEEPLKLNADDLVQLVEDLAPDPEETRRLDAMGLQWSGPPRLACVETKPPAPRNRAERRAARRRR